MAEDEQHDGSRFWRSLGLPAIAESRLRCCFFTGFNTPGYSYSPKARGDLFR